MIKIKDIDKSEPYNKLKDYYDLALCSDQESIEAISISSYDKETNQVESRYVNLKYIIGKEMIFFSNYNSTKANNFKDHKQISALIYWNKIDLQIRMKAEIRKTDPFFSDEHFKKRKKEKNALAISSKQSQIIDSHKDVKKSYENILDSNDLFVRPNYWGGYSFIPYYFEFWKGHEFRLNKRDVYELKNKEWIRFKLQP